MFVYSYILSFPVWKYKNLSMRTYLAKTYILRNYTSALQIFFNALNTKSWKPTLLFKKKQQKTTKHVIVATNTIQMFQKQSYNEMMPEFHMSW